MKIFDVEGSFLDPVGEQSKTQDMTFNNAPVLELRDLPTTVEIFKIRETHFNEPQEIDREMKKRSDAKLQMAPKQLPNHHFLAYAMYSQSAYRWGEYVCKYALFPSRKLQQDLASQCKVETDSDEDQHSKWIQQYFQEHDAEYELKVQLCQSLREQSLEDTGQPWDETAFPFQTVGRIVLLKGQDSFSPERRTFWDDKMKLNVWYGLESMRPLGSVNRLRNKLYDMAARNRAETNVTDVVYVDDIDQIP